MIQVVTGGWRELKKGKTNQTFISFNAYIYSVGEKLGVLITGLRVSGGKILPPVKWNPMSKKFFNTSYFSEETARAISESVRVAQPDLPLDDGDGSWTHLVYDTKRLAQLLPENVEG